MIFINFGEETISKLVDYNYTINDIDWIGNRSMEIPVHEFFDAARNTMYDAGYGGASMPLDLLIVMKDGSYFERGEYDGSEWWRYVPIIERPSVHAHLKNNSFINNFEFDPCLKDFIE